jgi:hypothetical protein
MQSEVTTMQPKEILLNGQEILSPYLNQHGFYFSLTSTGIGSGGEFASGIFSKQNRIINLHYRYGLGLVSYQIDKDQLSHEEYLRLTGNFGKNQYPGFSAEKLKAFENLLYDLMNFCNDFIDGSENIFKEHLLRLRNNPNMFKGLKGI